jgi:hypothetical protein
MGALALDYSQPDKMKDCVVCSYDGYSSYLLVIDEASRFGWIFLTAKSLLFTSSGHFWHNMATPVAAASALIKVANLLGAPVSAIFSSATSTTPSNPPAPTALPRTALRRFIMTSLPSDPGLSCMVLASPRSFGRRLFSIPSISIIDLPTGKQRKLRSSSTTVANRTCHH